MNLMDKFENDPLGLLQELGGYYIRPEGGPLVGYAGTYEEDGEELNYVGEVYTNFAKAENEPVLMHHWAKQIIDQYDGVFREADVFLGAPEGGKSFADKLALCARRRYVYPNTKEVEVKGKRPGKEFFWGRHELLPGQEVLIVEDVANNFSTSGKLIQLVKDSGCTPIGLVSILNRSPDVDEVFKWEGESFPVFNLVRKPMPEYRQDHIDVINDIAADNIVWEPKKKGNWQDLVGAMNRAS